MFHVDLNERLLDDPAPLRHLHGFTEKELAKLTKKYQSTQQQLDTVINDYPLLLWSERIQNWLACASGSLAIVIIINTGSKAVVSFVHTINSDLPVPDLLADGIGWPISILSTGVYFLSFSPRKEAVKSVLEYAYRKPFKILIWEGMQYTQQYPALAALDVGQFLLNHSVTFIMNVTGGIVVLIDIINPLSNLPMPANIFIIGLIAYFSARFYAKYLNARQQEGLNFWWQWLKSDKKQANIATTIEIFLQASCATGLRAFPYYYYITEETAKIFGWWIPSYIVSAAVVYQNTALMYTTFDYYFDDERKLEKMLLERRDIDAPEIYADDFIATERKKLVAQVIEKHGRLFLLKQDKPVIVLLVYDAFIGAYLGYDLGLLCPGDSIARAILSSMLLGSLFFATLYKAEETRVMNKLQLKEEENENIAHEELTVNELLAVRLGVAINVAASVANGTLIMGMALRIFENPILKLLINFFAGKKILANYVYNKENFSNTLKANVPKGNIFQSLTFFCCKRPKKRTEIQIQLAPISAHR